MKTNYIKYSIGLIAALFITIAAKAQTKVLDKTTNDAEKRSSYDISRNENGSHMERAEVELDNKEYRMDLADDKMTVLYVDGEKIPEADWNKYSDAIAVIREQIKQNREQALRNQAQARLNQAQSAKNEEQARLNQIQDKKNQEQAERNQEQAARNQEQAQRNELQNKKNQEQAERDRAQAQLNQEQAAKNQEQARLNQLQAKKTRSRPKKMNG